MIHTFRADVFAAPAVIVVGVSIHADALTLLLVWIGTAYYGEER